MPFAAGRELLRQGRTDLTVIRMVPDIVVDKANPTAWVKSNPKRPLMFEAVGQTQPMTLVPLYTIIPERYAVYWKVTNKSS